MICLINFDLCWTISLNFEVDNSGGANKEETKKEEPVQNETEKDLFGDSSEKDEEEKPKKRKKSDEDEDEQVSKKQKPDEVAPRLIL